MRRTSGVRVLGAGESRVWARLCDVQARSCWRGKCYFAKDVVGEQNATYIHKAQIHSRILIENKRKDILIGSKRKELLVWRERE